MSKSRLYDLLILDMDGTLYDINDVIRAIYQMQVEFYSEYSGETIEHVEKIFENNNIRPYVSDTTRSATEFFISNGVDCKEWSEFRKNNFDVTIINKNKAVKEEVIEEISKSYPIVLLSTNTKESISKVLERIEIDENVFKDIVCSDNHDIAPFNKENAISMISIQNGCEPSRMLSIGDRYQTDIVPMLKLGGDGVVVNGPEGTSRVLSNLKNGSIERNDKYKLYKHE